MRAKDAPPEVIFPGSGAAKPIPKDTREIMKGFITVLESLLPNWGIALFVKEPEELAKEQGKEFPDFNYISNMDREDMHAMMRAWLIRNIQQKKVAAKIEDVPNTGHGGPEDVEPKVEVSTDPVPDAKAPEGQPGLSDPGDSVKGQ
jgi:hypothetical protein